MTSLTGQDPDVHVQQCNAKTAGFMWHTLGIGRLTAADTAGVIPDNRPIHSMTVRRRLREIGLRPRCPAIRPILTLHHRQARLQWCRTHLRHPLRWWQFVMFTDESRFQLSRSDGWLCVYNGEMNVTLIVALLNVIDMAVDPWWFGVASLPSSQHFSRCGWEPHGERYRAEIPFLCQYIYICLIWIFIGRQWGGWRGMVYSGTLPPPPHPIQIWAYSRREYYKVYQNHSLTFAIVHVEKAHTVLLQTYDTPPWKASNLSFK